MNLLKKIESKIPEPRSGVKLVLTLLIAAVVLAGMYYIAEYGTFTVITSAAISERDAAKQFLNLGTLAVPWMLLLMLTNRVWLSGLITCGCVGIIAVINFFVRTFHGMPLSFMVLRNFTTAMNVVSGMEFVFDIPVIRLILMTGALCGLLLLLGGLRWELRAEGKAKWLRNLVLVGMIAVVVWTGYAGPNPIKPDGTLRWAWQNGYYTYGFAPSTVESFFQIRKVVNRPEGYDQEALNRLSAASVSEGQETPDVVLIVNETFYDLRHISDFETDHGFMDNIDSMDNLLKGKAVVPADSGNTNGSEFELLTGNSMYLMPGVTPFNTLDLNGINSIVSYMNRLGYYTIGAHSESGTNYSRNIGYDMMGFDEIHFEDSYEDKEFVAEERFLTDASAFRNLIRWYEQAPEEQPRFSYMLTMQNHTPWGLLPDELDTVHSETDFGDTTVLLNEYLSRIAMTDAAFKELTDYFSTVDRPVIVCMVGDHSPGFIRKLANRGNTEEELDLLVRQTPLLIWANYPLPEVELGTMGMTMVVPTLLELADMPGTAFYDHQLQLKQQVPITTAYGVYVDKDGTSYDYDDTTSPYYDAVQTYLSLVYQNIKTTENRAFYLP